VSVESQPAGEIDTVGIHRFEDIIAWQKARCLTKQIYETTQSGAFSKDFLIPGSQPAFFSSSSYS
jgi:hypothetical protein